MKLFYITVFLLVGFFQNTFSQTNEKRPVPSCAKEWKDTTYYKVSIDSTKNRPSFSMYKNVVFQKDTVVRINNKGELKKENQSILKYEGKKDENN